MSDTVTSTPTLRNKGGDYRRSTGVVVKRGETFTPGEQEYAVLVQGRKIGIRFEEVAEEQSNAPVGKQAPAKVPTMKDWKKKVSPQEYLNQWPNGPQAALARQLVEE